METGNQILDLLPPAARPSFEKTLVSLPAGTELVGQGRRITHAFFPTTAVCSMVVELASGDKAETASVGKDGFVGVGLVLGEPVAYGSGVIQVAGAGYRLSARQVLELCSRHEGFRKALFGYSAFKLHLAARSAACNAFHSLRQRLARWLLSTHDRSGAHEFALTHEALAAMLAATRPRISEAAAKLKAEGLIDYQRGRVRILQRARLEAVSCECYRDTRRLPRALAH
jgi:CRP-like cAMP-binding protein